MRQLVIALALAAGVAAAGPASAAQPAALSPKQQAAVRDAVAAALEPSAAPAFGKMAAVRTPVGSVVVCGLVAAGDARNRTYMVLVLGGSARFVTMGGDGPREALAASQCAQYGMTFAPDTVAAAR
ncbi:hypothetical protein [Reyranella sp.]|uniref:hypothetical protein n=1 Tax=Reyranella sp. TaxID=1929291 RepID=UPI002F93DF5D